MVSDSIGVYKKFAMILYFVIILKKFVSFVRVV
jgi:hypothetical protein